MLAKSLSYKSASAWIYLLIIVLIAGANFNVKRWKELGVIDWDVIGYYAYLPSTFIYHDYKLNFLEQHPEFGAEKKFWPLIAPNGKRVNKFSMGMSVLYAPFFFAAHIRSQVMDSNADGFSWYYHKYVHLSCLFYLAAGLYFLRLFLLRRFSEWSVACTLLAVCLATNLFYYATTEAAMSHAYSFSLSALLLYATQRWYESQHIRHALFVGLFLGLLVLVRPINGLFVLFPLLYGLRSFSLTGEQLRLFAAKSGHLVLAAATAFLVVLPQLLYWKSVTDQYLFFSYVGERFYFLQPHILSGMFSFRNGWLVYTPVMGLAFAGIYRMLRNGSNLFYAVALPFFIYLFIAFSWWCWWYVGFGNRSMIDLYAVLSVPVAAFFQFAFQSGRSWTISAVVILVLAMGLNLFQTLQYRRGLIHYDSMTWPAYQAIFGKLHYNDAYKNGLHQPDYERAMKGEYLR